MIAAGDDPAFPDDAVEVARIVGAWGVKGGLRVKPFSADPQALFSTKRWFLQAPAATGPRVLPPAGSGATRRPGPHSKPAAAVSWPRLLRVVQAREHGDHVVVTAQDLTDRDAAESLAGARVFVSRASFPAPEADEFYWVDLIGLAVRNREGVVLGTVAGLLETGPTSVMRVQPPEAEGAPQAVAKVGGVPPVADDAPAGAPAETLIPFVAAYVDRVDLPGRCVHVDWQPDY